MMQLPTFRYHPDPVATGMIEVTEEECPCCERERGYRYTSEPFAEEELADLCPWCISDGSAAAKYDAEFTDPDSIGLGVRPDTLPPEIVTEITRRTPGFSGWQQEQWWTHCHDGAAYLGRAGAAELEGLLEFEAALRADLGLNDEAWGKFRRALSRDGSPTAYVFRCLHCGAYGGYTDTD
ncbi:CbrC family protein [Deinococcus sp. UYEF24]